MGKLKKSLLCFLVGIMVIAISNGNSVVRANGDERDPIAALENQMSLLNRIIEESVINEWKIILQESIANGDVELRGNNYMYEKANVYQIENTPIISISVPIISPDHHDISNLAVHFDKNTKEIIAYAEMELKRSEQNTFQLQYYLDGALQIDEIYSETFMTSEEFDKARSELITPFGIDWGGVADCLKMPRDVLLNVAYICGTVCVITLGTGCVVCVSLALGAGGGAVTACLGQNWN